MKKIRLSVSIVVILALAMVFGGCAKPPNVEKQAAKAAMDGAVSAGADKYGAPDLEAAKKIWDTAESQMKDKKYKEARQNYIDAKAAFEKVAAEAGKKAASDQANAALTAIEESWKKVEMTAKKMERKLKDKELWATDAKAISEDLGRVKEMIATNPSQAKAKLDELKAIIDKWENTFKEMASAPPKAETSKKGKK